MRIGGVEAGFEELFGDVRGMSWLHSFRYGDWKDLVVRKQGLDKKATRAGLFLSRKRFGMNIPTGFRLTSKRGSRQ